MYTVEAYANTMANRIDFVLLVNWREISPNFGYCFILVKGKVLNLTN